jgi:hypothetical protein
VTDADGKSVRQWKMDAGGLGHLPAEVSLAPGKEFELADLQYELWPAHGMGKSSTLKFPRLCGDGKVNLQCRQVFGNSSLGKIKLDSSARSLPGSWNSKLVLPCRRRDDVCMEKRPALASFLVPLVPEGHVPSERCNISRAVG